MELFDLLGPIPDTRKSVLANRLHFRLVPSNAMVRAALSAIITVCVVGVICVCLVLNPGAWVLVGILTFLALAFARKVLRRAAWRIAFLAMRRAGGLSPLATVFGCWDDLVNRLQGSRHQCVWKGEVVREGAHIFLGTVHGTLWPVLAAILKVTHVLTTGGTGSGKTHRFLVPAGVQLIRRRGFVIIVIDLKGDIVQYMKLALEARRAGVDFRWLCLEALKSSYVFNPLKQRFFARLAPSAVVQILAQALNLEAGGRHEDVFFSDINEKALRRIYERFRPESFRQLLEILERPGIEAEVGISLHEWRFSAHLRAVVDRLARHLPLNVVGPGREVSPQAISASLQMDDVIGRPQVLYAWLPATLEPTTGRAVARLLVQIVVAAAKVHQGERVPVVVVADEFQELVGRNVDSILKQCRDLNISLWMAHQVLDDLRQGSADYISSVMGNVGLQVHFRAGDARIRDHLIQSSGETIRHMRGRSVDLDGGESEQTREAIVPRLSPEDIVALNADPALAAVCFTPGTPLAPFRHPMLVRTTFCVGPREFQRLRGLPWPRGNAYTVTNPGPEAEDQVVRPPDTERRSTLGEPRNPDSLPPSQRDRPAEAASPSADISRERASELQPVPARRRADEGGPGTPPSSPQTEQSERSELEAYLRRLRAADEDAL